MSRWYRLQDNDRDAAELLDPANQWSQNWSQVDDLRRGVSVCGTELALARYFAARNDDGAMDPEFIEAALVLVELEGAESDEQDSDHAEGARLIFPTRIVSVGPVPADMVELICA